MIKLFEVYFSEGRAAEFAKVWTERLRELTGENQEIRIGAKILTMKVEVPDGTDTTGMKEALQKGTADYLQEKMGEPVDVWLKEI
ncbi:MAG: hypothetical protein HOO67_06390 [Candidatus Peribacteraceae bacterium]|nr:hypothetical protein [Candidatus Peribacteraceae bacterium]